MTINPVSPTGAVTITPADGATDVPVNTVVTGRVPSGDIRTIFNKDTFTLKPGVVTERLGTRSVTGRWRAPNASAMGSCRGRSPTTIPIPVPGSPRIAIWPTT